jgi:hypothetical protein
VCRSVLTQIDVLLNVGIILNFCIILIKTLSLLFKMTFAILRFRNDPFGPHHIYFGTPILDRVGLRTVDSRLLITDVPTFSTAFRQQGHHSVCEGTSSSRLKWEERESVQSHLHSVTSI